MADKSCTGEGEPGQRRTSESPTFAEVSDRLLPFFRNREPRKDPDVVTRINHHAAQVVVEAFQVNDGSLSEVDFWRNLGLETGQDLLPAARVICAYTGLTATDAGTVSKSVTALWRFGCLRDLEWEDAL